MRSLYQIGLCFKPGVHVESATLAYHLVSATEEVFGVVLEALGQHNYASHSCSDELSVAMTAAGRVFAGVMTGVQKLHRMKEANLVAGKVTYAIVRMYERLAGGLDTISENEAKLEQKADPINDPKNMSARQKTKSKGPPRVNIKDVPVLNALTAFLSGVIKQLDVKEASHREIFEGFLFCALSKVGKNIYTIVFSQPRGLSISEEIHSGTLPDDSNQTKFALPLRQAQLEAPYLIHLLKQVLALAPTFISPSTAPLSRPAKLKTSAKPGSVTKASLTLATKERLQATLINAIFGTEGLDEESDLMLNCLQAPAAVGHQLPVPRVKEAEIGEWFQGEVWRLLGWEALGRELGDHGRRWL